ncbi:hypothetical protein G3480_04185 [Thiorhodococcus mannitoliphagus]|uniref:Uncharacterized protein n=1 Tax=Thiorhodococcus mannitoliphagus TaxID=329406 RepID=A0A6P1DNB3_9GAMM|nr:hypothetical protein [Thiorhodococcus mannitoliphagus]NEX19518.1 hypothetical protein [Thiorhodococcus mannitoliphagus]
MTPLEKTEALYRELIAGYGDGEERELRAAAKLLMVALSKLKEHGGPGWQGLVDEYLIMLRNDPERFERMLESNRGQGKRPSMREDGAGSLIA